MPLRLTAFLASGPAKRRIIHEGESLLIGRGEGSDLVLPDPRVSRAHARLASDEAGWRIEDIVSKNGTQVDGRIISVARLDDDAWLSLGGVLVRTEFIDRSAAMASAATERSRKSRGEKARDALSSGSSEDAILGAALEGAIDLGGCERASIWLRDATGTPRLAMRKGSADPHESRSVIESVMATGEPMLTHDVEGVTALARRESIMLGGIRALICLPLMSGRAVDGAIYADSRAVGKVFTDLDAALLRGLADHAALSIAALRFRSEIQSLARETGREAARPAALA